MEAVEFAAYASNGVIEIPVEYRKDYSSGIRVILIKENHNRYNTEPSIQERIAAAERLAGFASNNSMTLEEIRNGRLARQ